MKPEGVPLGSVAGIPLRVHASWLLALFLATTSLSVELRPVAARAAPALALLTALAFFASLVAHELGHALVARRRGINVSSITLFVFGGIASLEREATRARDAIAIAIAGPVVSIAIGAAALALGHSGLLPRIVAEPLTWLGRVNLGLAAFNLLPGLPLDGGHVLRGLWWMLRGDPLRATVGAARVGQAIGSLFLVLGIVRAIGGSFGDGLWVGFIGWFLVSMARGYADSARLRAALGSAPVSEAMARDYPYVDGRLSLATFVHEVVMRGGQRVHVVALDGAIAGVVTLERVLAVPRHQWAMKTVVEVAAHVKEVPVLAANAPIVDALAQLGDAPLAFVSDGASIVGVVDRDRLASVAGVRLELGASPEPRGYAPARLASR